MKVTPLCFECVLKQARTTALYVTKDEEKIALILKETAKRISQSPTDISPAEFSMAAYDAVRDLTEVSDPYKEQKARFNEIALSLYPQLKKLVESSSDPFHTASLLAAAGNVIDLGIGINVDLEQEIGRVLRGGFKIDHVGRFRQEISHARSLVYCFDNAGEIVFDRLFIEQILKVSPSLQVVGLVKGGPIINDATLEDAKIAGLTDLIEVTDIGPAAIGVPISRVKPEVCALVTRSDVLLGKGQGNFETLDSVRRGFYAVLKAKCPSVASALGVGEGQVVFMKRETG